MLWTTGPTMPIFDISAVEHVASRHIEKVGGVEQV
jgi:hypothetical protein